MRIALVSEHASPLASLGGADAGGQNVHVAALATALARAREDVVVYTRRDDPDTPGRVELAPGVVVEQVPAGPARFVPKDELLPHMGELAAGLQRAWREEPPDVVHAHFWMSGLASLRAARPLRLPVVQTFHALGLVKRRHQGAMDTSPPERISIEAGIVRRAARVIATCTDEVRELAGMGADARRVWVVPCGVDLDRFRPDGPAEARPPGRFRLVAVTRLVERKGIGDLIGALADLPGADLVVAGGPARRDLAGDPEARRLLAVARRMGVSDRVELRGGVPRAAVPMLMRSADAVVCPPWYEPFGMVAVEAMACGVPVVATAVGGHLDTVVDGQTGVHVEPRRPEALAAALNRLLADPARRARMGAAGAERARARYGWDEVARATLDAYHGVVDRAARDAGRARLDRPRRTAVGE